MMTRRQALKTTALASVAIASASNAVAQGAVTSGGNNSAASLPPVFNLPSLPYAFDALEPHIDARTMEIHHDRHHAAYVTNLNNALAGAPDVYFAVKSNGATMKALEKLLSDINSLPENIRAPIRNNGGGHFNHSLFWQMMAKNGGGEPKGELAKAIDAKFGSFAAFKDAFTKAALSQFGSGWAWLTLDNKELAIEATPNQDSPISASLVSTGIGDGQGRLLTKIHRSQQPLLGIDVWEHAYYLKYQNKRADYIAAWWNVVNWEFVADRFAQASKA